MRYAKPGFGLVLVLCAAAMAGCSDGGGRSTGTVSISLMDRPVDGVRELWVTITEIWIKPHGEGPPEPLPMTASPIKVNLLSLTDENPALIVFDAAVEPGSYNWIEFTIDDSDANASYAITDTGTQEFVDIDVPSDRIRIVSPFEVAPNQAVKLLFDWEVNNGLIDPPGQDGYILKPTFRVLRADSSGSISGQLTSTTALSDSNCNGVVDTGRGGVAYFFEGDVVPDDIDGKEAEPVTTADAVYDADALGYVYRAALIPNDEGYTVAFTCLGANETRAGEEDLMFLSPLSGVSLYTVTIETPVEDVNF